MYQISQYLIVKVQYFTHLNYLQMRLIIFVIIYILKKIPKTWIKNPEKEESTTYENFIESCESDLILDVTNDH